MTSEETGPGAPPPPAPSTPAQAPVPPAQTPPSAAVPGPAQTQVAPVQAPVTPVQYQATAAPAAMYAPGPDPMDRARQAFSRFDSTGWRPTAIVAGVLAAVFFGSQLVNAIIPAPGVAPGPGTGPGDGPIPPIVVPTDPQGPGSGPLPPGSFLTAGPLRIPLVAGWQPATTPSGGAAVSIVKGAVQIDLLSASITGGTGAPAGVYNSYMNFIGEGATGFGSTQPATIQIGGIIPAARGSYTGFFGQNQLEGEVTAFVTGTSDGWVWDAWGPSGTLGAVLVEVHTMIDNVQLAGGGG